MGGEFYSNLRLLTSLLFKDGTIPDDIKNDFMKYYLSRLMSLFTSKPKICYYINSTMNNLFIYNKLEPEDVMFTLRKIVQVKRITKKSDLFIAKRFYDTDVDRITEALKILNVNDSNHAVRRLVDLMKNNVISLDISLKSELKKDVKPSNDETDSRIQVLSSMDISNSDQVKELCENIKSFISRRTICKSCPLYGSTPVVLETNLKEPGEVDVALIGINPGEEEAKLDRPFIGKAGKLLREKFDKLILSKHKNIKFLITNVILCSTSNESKIPNVSKVISNCRYFLNTILDYFPAKYIVLFGDKACLSFGLSPQGGMVKNNARLINNVIISVHPSAALRNSKYAELIDDTFKKLAELLDKTKTVETEKSLEESSIPENAMLLDIKRIGEDIIWIFSDSSGKKYYKKEPVKLKGYIKTGSYMDCDLIESKMDAVFTMTAAEREILISELNINLRNIINMEKESERRLQ